MKQARKIARITQKQAPQNESTAGMTLLFCPFDFITVRFNN